MKREFVNMPEFEKNWCAAGLNDDDPKKLQLHLCKNPSSGVVITGTGGLRKLRCIVPGKGKREKRRIRFIYIDFVKFEKYIYLYHILRRLKMI